MLGRERVSSNGKLKLITVKMRWAPVDEEIKHEDSFDQEETKASSSNNKGKDGEAKTSGFQSKWKLKFDYVTSLGPKIENFREDKQKPNYLNVVMATA